MNVRMDETEFMGLTQILYEVKSHIKALPPPPPPIIRPLYALKKLETKILFLNVNTTAYAPLHITSFSLVVVKKKINFSFQYYSIQSV